LRSTTHFRFVTLSKAKELLLACIVGTAKGTQAAMTYS